MSSRGQSAPKPAERSERDGGPGEAAGYLAEAVAELARIARRHRLDMLCYLLEMAQLEAGEVVRLHRAQRSQD
jgi:hypothetical protein